MNIKIEYIYKTVYLSAGLVFLANLIFAIQTFFVPSPDPHAGLNEFLAGIFNGAYLLGTGGIVQVLNEKLKKS